MESRSGASGDDVTQVLPVATRHACAPGQGVVVDVDEAGVRRGHTEADAAGAAKVDDHPVLDERTSDGFGGWVPPPSATAPSRSSTRAGR
jgi:hypothetical protein